MGNTNTELFNLQLIVTGKEEADDLKAKIALTEQKISSLWSTMKGNPAAFQQAIKADVAVLNDLQTKLKETEQKISSLGGAKSKGGGGRALLEVSRGVEDLQYGLNGVLNNIPGIVSALGGPAGLVGVISLVSVGAYQLYKNWDSLASLWGGGHTKTQAEEMEELRKKTSLTADEAERLARADNLSNKTKELRAGKTEAQDAEEKATTKAITEAGLSNVVQMVKQYAPEMIESQGEAAVVKGNIDRLTKELADAEAIDAADPGGMSVAAPIRVQLEKENAKLKDAINSTAESIVSSGALPKDWPGNRAKLQSVAEKAAQAEPEKYIGLALDLADADPEVAKEKKRQDAHDKRVKATKAEQDKEAKEEASRLEKEARENEKIWDDKMKNARKNKTWVGKSPGQMQPEDEAAKAEFDKQEAGVATAIQNQSWLGKEDEELTPEEKIGRRRHQQKQQDKADNLRNIKEATPELTGLLTSSLEGAMKFGGLEKAQAKLFEDLKGKYGEDAANSLLKESTGNARKNVVSDMMNMEMPKSESASVINGASALRDSIQGSVRSPEYDLLQKQLVEYQRANQFLETLTKRPVGLG